MDAQQAFGQFVQRSLSPEKARRFTELCATKKGSARFWLAFVTNSSRRSCQAQFGEVVTTAFGVVRVLFSMSRWDLVLRLRRFARRTISCHLRTVGSSCFAMPRQAFIARRRDGMMRNSLANQITRNRCQRAVKTSHQWADR